MIEHFKARFKTIMFLVPDYIKDMFNNRTVAIAAINLLQIGIKEINKDKIILAYEMIAKPDFIWEDNLKYLNFEWHQLLSGGNKILFYH